MKYNFAGKCHLNIENHILEFEDYVILGDYCFTSEDIDFQWEIVPFLKEEQEIVKLNDGQYHIFFVGQYDYESNYNHEYGVTDYDFVINEFEVSIFEIPENMKFPKEDNDAEWKK